MIELLIVLGWAVFCLLGGVAVTRVEARIKAHYAPYRGDR